MATFIEDLQLVSSEIDSYDEQKIIPTGYPLNHYMTEIMICQTRFVRKRAALEGGGMDFTLVEKLKLFGGACRQLQSEASTTLFSSSASQKAWNEKVEEADFLLWDIKEAGVYACRSMPDLVAKIYAIYNEGGSNSDKIQDLNDYAVIGKEHEALFTAIRYDMNNFKRAAELAYEMNELLATATLDKSDSPELRIRRDKAFTIAKKLLDELNAHARCILRSNRLEAEEYMVAPPRKKPAKKTPEPVKA